MIEYTARVTSQDTPRVGGRNLLLNSDKSLSNKEYYVGRYDISDPSLMVADEYYTIQIWGAAEGADDSESMWVYNSGGNTEVASIQKSENGVWQMTFKWKDDSGKLNRYLNLFRGANHPNWKKGYSTTIARIKLERGTVATDWTPAPEDVADSISTVNTSLVSLASTLLDPDTGDIPKLTSQLESHKTATDKQIQHLYQGVSEALTKANNSLEGLANTNQHIDYVSQDLSSANKYIDNAFGYIQNIFDSLSSKHSYSISTTGYVTPYKVDSCLFARKDIKPPLTHCNPPQEQSQVRLTLRSDHDALKRQVDSLTAQLAQLQAATKITPVLDTYLRREYDPVSRKRGITIHPDYGDWILTSDTTELHLSFEGLKAEIGRSIYIQTRKRVYLLANGHSFYGLPGTSSSVAVNQWLSNNTTYRFVRASSDSWLVTSSPSPYPWT